jgi:outer membrane protein assembly factor BamA
VRNLFSRYRILVGLSLFTCASNLHAQEPPPLDENPPAAEQRRIVDGRPALYTFKRGAHPLSWVSAGVRPIFKLAESELLKKFARPKPREHFKVEMTGMGSGSGFGPEITLFDRNFLGTPVEVEVPLLYTYKHYQSYGLNARLPLTSDSFVDKLTFDVGTAYRSRAGDKFFGMGNESLLDDRSSFRTVTREAAVGLSADVNEAWRSGFRVAYRNTGVTDPRSGSSTQDMFATSNVPGLFTGATILATELFFDQDTRPKDEIPRSGGVKHFEVSLNEGISKGDFSYWKYRFEFQQLFPLTSDKRKLIALRGAAETNQEKGGSGVPFFDMPTLGNWGTLRGFDNYRFYDKSAMSVGIEYRYRIWEPMDFGLFVDAGQVAPEIGDFGFDRFHTGYGVRLIATPSPKVPISIDIARSSEKWRWYVNFSKRF